MVKKEATTYKCQLSIKRTLSIEREIKEEAGNGKKNTELETKCTKCSRDSQTPVSTCGVRAIYQLVHSVTN